MKKPAFFLTIILAFVYIHHNETRKDIENSKVLQNYYDFQNRELMNEMKEMTIPVKSFQPMFRGGAPLRKADVTLI